jgi:hypothetical protein
VVEAVRLPEAFRTLEGFAETWALPSSDQRLYKRMNSSMEEIQAFYDAVLPLAERALAHLDEYDPCEMPPAERRLYHLLLASTEAALAVEVYHAPRLPLSPTESRFKVTHHHMGD